MAKTKISEFSATPGNNTDIDGINIAEGCAPSGINDAIRELMSQLKDFQAGTAGDSFNGPVGTTTAAAGAFTTLSASGTVSGTGFSNYLASPPAIGGTTAAAGSFTTLSASGAVTLSGGTANGVAYLNGSKVLTTGSALTFDGTNLFTLSANAPKIRVSDSGIAADFGLDFYFPSIASSYGQVTLNGSTGGMRFVAGKSGSTGYYQAFELNGSEAMRLTSTGLGIGTSSPATKFVVSNAGALGLEFDPASGAMQVYNRSTSAYGTMNLLANTMYFRTGASPAINMTLDVSGNLGIGTSSPAQKLDIVGSGKATNAFAVGDSSGNWSGSMLNESDASKSITFNADPANVGASSFMRWNVDGSERMRLDSSGNLLVGQTARGGQNSNSFDLDVQNAAIYLNHVNGTAGGTSYENYYYNATLIGSITQNGTTAVAFNTTSDHRLKENVTPLTGALAKVQALKPSEFDWIDGRHDDGFIAHELQAVLPNVVTGEKDAVDEDGNPKYQQVDYARIVPTLCAAIQEQQVIIQQLTARVAQLESN